jgi:hypothetical protein
MNIQALAAQAGFIVDSDSQKYQQQCIQSTHSLIDEPLKKFAKLVAAQVYEECANIAMRVAYATEPDDWALDKCNEIEQAILTRSRL